MPDVPRCRTCVFFVEREDLTDYTYTLGECRFHAPIPTLDVQMVNWPLVNAEAFCGQWKDVW